MQNHSNLKLKNVYQVFCYRKYMFVVMERYLRYWYSLYTLNFVYVCAYMHVCVHVCMCVKPAKRVFLLSALVILLHFSYCLNSYWVTHTTSNYTKASQLMCSYSSNSSYLEPPLPLPPDGKIASM